MKPLDLLLIVTLSHAGPCGAQSLSGKPRIVDGDTIEIAGTRIRLEGIDAPERGQECSDGRQHS